MSRLLSQPCPCRLREPEPHPNYAECCGRWHQGYALGDHAPTPQLLMRSRYSAYALLQGRGVAPKGVHDYLLQTWHASTAPGELALFPMPWTGLEVLDEALSGDHGVVEFKAHHKVNGRATVLHEISRFVLVAGAWKYIDGVMPQPDEDAGP